MMQAAKAVEESEHAIFVDLRQSLLPLFEAANQGRTDDEYLAYVQRQRDKGGCVVIFLSRQRNSFDGDHRPE